MTFESIAQFFSEPAVLALLFVVITFTAWLVAKWLERGSTNEALATAMTLAIQRVIEDQATLKTLESNIGNLPERQRKIALAFVDLIDPFTPTNSLPDDVEQWVREILDGIPSETKVAETSETPEARG